MRLPRLVPLFVLALAACVVSYSATVERGRMSMRAETLWEVAASGSNPFATTIYAEQRLPQYPSRWLAPAFGVIHTFDLCLRWKYWHESDIPDFDDAPDFTVLPTPTPPTPSNAFATDRGLTSPTPGSRASPPN
jgi:hypothetical protein